ncbi:GPN-loop GTPase 1 [Pelomyxa schiedti]|nr:GPN-loop GTPase 1 [Pelomyxa schiedti]
MSNTEGCGDEPEAKTEAHPQSTCTTTLSGTGTTAIPESPGTPTTPGASQPPATTTTTTCTTSTAATEPGDAATTPASGNCGSSSAAAGAADGGGMPTVCIVIGMAGSGKSTLVQRLASHLSSEGKRPYCINLDPAVTSTPFQLNIDIRDTVRYKEVMSQYSLGPNGAIMTSLNLFATRFDQVVNFIEKRAHERKYVIVDTPGQIEAFTWSASGTIITESLGSTFPTVIVYVVDVPRSVANPSTFMANMLYACSVMYKTRLPLVLALTKTDVMSEALVVEWMKDFDVFHQALKSDTSYANDLMWSMTLVLDEFYNSLSYAAVSSITGSGMPEFFAAVDKAVIEYNTTYLPEMRKLQEKRMTEKARQEEAQLRKLKADLAKNKAKSTTAASTSRAHRPSDDGEAEGEDSSDPETDNVDEREEEDDEPTESAWDHND